MSAVDLLDGGEKMNANSLSRRASSARARVGDQSSPNAQRNRRSFVRGFEFEDLPVCVGGLIEKGGTDGRTDGRQAM